jgi:hypothetical protein
MSILFPKTWTSERLNAEDVRDNLDAMKNKQQKLNSYDMQTTLPWIDTHHLMQGRYTTTTNMTENISGTFAGRNNGAFTNRTSYCTRYISDGLTDSKTRKYITYSNITFDILRPCTLFFQWHMVHQSPAFDSADNETHIHVGLQTPIIAGVAVDHIIAEQPNASVHDVLIDGTQITNGFILRDISSQIKGYNIGLAAQSTAEQCMNISWSVSLECFYM